MSGDPSDELGALTAKALADTEAAKGLLKEIAALSGTLKTLQNELEREREMRAALEARVALLEGSS